MTNSKLVPEVREYLITALIRLISDYKLDGFKIDFIDLFYEVKGNTTNDKMDFLSVQERTPERCLLSLSRVFRRKLLRQNYYIRFHKSNRDNCLGS